MKPNKNEVGKRLNAIRIRSNLSFSEFGKRLGVPKGTANSWIRGLGVPPKEKLKQIALLAGTTIDWILWGDGTATPMIQTAIIICPYCHSEQHDTIFSLAKNNQEFKGSFSHICDACIIKFTVEFEFRPHIRTISKETTVSEGCNVF